MVNVEVNIEIVAKNLRKLNSPPICLTINGSGNNSEKYKYLHIKYAAPTITIINKWVKKDLILSFWKTIKIVGIKNMTASGLNKQKIIDKNTHAFIFWW